MIPIVLHGHNRAITQIKYNSDGDLLFTAGKDITTSVWYANNGERLGTYNGHRGAVFSHDVTHDTLHYVTASGDFNCKLWDVETGVCLNSLEYESTLNSVGFSISGNLILVGSKAQMGHPSKLAIFDVRDGNQIGKPHGTPIWSVAIKADELGDITNAVWGPFSNTIITGHSKGEIVKWDAVNGEKLLTNTTSHKDTIVDLQMYPDKTMFVTASKDHSAKLFDSFDLQNMKKFKSDMPVNSAALSPTHDFVIIGGGQEARDVTTQGSAKQGKFEARLFHVFYEEEFGRIKGHFGPINSIAYAPDGTGYTSGSEDGLVRVHKFESTYFDFSMDVDE